MCALGKIVWNKKKAASPPVVLLPLQAFIFMEIKLGFLCGGVVLREMSQHSYEWRLLKTGCSVLNLL